MIRTLDVCPRSLLSNVLDPRFEVRGQLVWQAKDDLELLLLVVSSREKT
jgi:hypothetical protein